MSCEVKYVTWVTRYLGRIMRLVQDQWNYGGRVDLESLTIIHCGQSLTPCSKYAYNEELTRHKEAVP